jgi:hypothetical protein
MTLYKDSIAMTEMMKKNMLVGYFHIQWKLLYKLKNTFYINCSFCEIALMSLMSANKIFSAQ